MPRSVCSAVMTGGTGGGDEHRGGRRCRGDRIAEGVWDMAEAVCERCLRNKIVAASLTASGSGSWWWMYSLQSRLFLNVSMLMAMLDEAALLSKVSRPHG